jgi:hypothetical protein
MIELKRKMVCWRPLWFEDRLDQLEKYLNDYFSKSFSNKTLEEKSTLKSILYHI